MLLINLLGPVDSNAGGGGPIGGDNKEDIIKFFETDDEPAPETIKLDKSSEKPDKGTKSGIDDDEETDEPKDKKGEKDDDEDDEEKDELEEIEEDLKKDSETDDDELELVEPVSRKEILAKYPKIFKEFPYLERAYYRERQFTDLFPTMEDAKVAVSRATALQNFEKQLGDGNIESVLTIVSKHNKEAFDKVVDTYIPTLMKVDAEAAYQVIGNVIKDTILSIHNKAKKDNNAELMKVARGLNEFVFNTDELEPKVIRFTGEKKEEKDDPVARREQELTRREFERNRDTLNNRVEGMLRRTVEENIDPRESMSEYVRRNATRDAIEEVTKIIEKDTRFAGLLDRLWEKAIKGDFKKVDLDRIKDAYSSKARTLLPSVIKKARQEALKGMGKRVREEPEEKEETEEPEDTTPRRKKSREATPSSNSGHSDKDRAKAIPANMSTRDYLDAD